MKVKLIVIRTQNPEKSAEFYSLLGLIFDYHKHGSSPYHYSASVDGLVLEIYPLAKDQSQPDRHLRLGFEIENFDVVINLLRDLNVLVSEPVQTNFGIMAIATDPDRRKIELYKPD